MQDRGKVINRLALVLLSIVVLELVLIGDQVQPVKAIKKKIFIKKLKKILPLLALMKPKKKLILVPIPIPMFNKPPMEMPMMDNYDMPMDYQQQSYSSGASSGGGYSQESNQGGGGGGGGGGGY